MSDGTQERTPIRPGRNLKAQICAAAALSLIALAIPAAAAPAAVDPCPNAAVRAQQGSQHLPDCRAYELVSQADKNGYQANAVWPPSTDGNRVAYRVLGGVPGSPSGVSLLLAMRGPDGWSSSSLRPSAAQSLGDHYLIGATATDMSAVIATAFDGLGSGLVSPDQSIVRLDAGGQQTPLQTFDAYFGSSGAELIAADDLSRVLVNSRQAFDLSHQPGTANVYEIASGTPHLASAMPATDEAPQCGVPFLEEPPAFPDAGTAGVAEHWISSDGSLFFFVTRGDDAPDCDDPPRLYVRDLDAGTTTQITGDPVGGDPDNGIWRFMQATPDGLTAFFTTATSYDPADDSDGDATDMDVYGWSAGSGIDCVTCVVPNAAVVDFGASDRAIASEDGSHVYFSSMAQLADAPEAAEEESPNTYVLHNGEVDFIARTDGLTGLPRNGGELTPDGNVLVFQTNRPEIDAVSGASNGGFYQYYRYDDTDGSVTCISCPSGGPPTGDVLERLVTEVQSVPAHARAVSDDGKTVFFVSLDSLVSADVNQDWDIYEWRDGAVGLITNGTTEYPGSMFPSVTSSSASGREVFFSDIAKHTADAQDGAQKVYSARIGGGFAVPQPPPPPCDGDTCLGPPSPGSGALGAGSDSFSASGNVAGRHSKPRKCGRGKHRVRANGKARCVKRGRTTNNRRTSR